MTDRARVVRRWLLGYVAVLLGTLPAALWCWNRWLQHSLGRFVTVEAIHVMQYAVLGWLASAYGQVARLSGHGRRTFIVGVAMVGLLDELIQSVLPGRLFQWSDVMLNGLGMLLGAGLQRGIRL